MMSNVNILKLIKSSISNYLWIRTVRKHKSRMGFLKAPAYSKYLKKCRSRYLKSNLINHNLSKNELSIINNFNSHGATSFISEDSNELTLSIFSKIKLEEKNKNIWSDSERGRYTGGDIYKKFPEVELLFKKVLEPYLEGIFQSYYQIYYGLIYKSLRGSSLSVGSEIWHSDSGPGICINLMVALSEVTSENGAMEVLPWPYSLEIYRNERKYLDNTQRHKHELVNNKKDSDRTIRAKFFENQIQQNYSHRLIQPQGDSGTVIAMMNNTIHRGGFPNENQSRYVCLFHVYPSTEPTPYKKYQKNGISKTGPYPKVYEL